MSLHSVCYIGSHREHRETEDATPTEKPKGFKESTEI